MPVVDQLIHLPDEVLVMIATRLPLEDFVHLRRTNQKMRKLLSQEAVLEQLAKIRGIEDGSPYKNMIQSLEHLHMYDAVKKMGFLEENRIGFEFGSLQVYDDHFDDQRDDIAIHGSTGRLIAVARLMRRFANLTVQLDSHCGSAAPSDDLANTFSVRRGRMLRNQWFGAILPMPLRVPINAWGKRAAIAASASKDHPYGALARRGEGWVEMRFGMVGQHNENFMLPLRPAFYKGLETENLNEYPFVPTVDWMVDWAEGGSDEEDDVNEREYMEETDEEDDRYIFVQSDDSDDSDDENEFEHVG